MDQQALRDSVVAMWRRNNDILLFLLAEIPRKGMRAVPSGSKGRDVSAQFYHLHRVRAGWIEYFTTGKRPSLPRYDKNRRPTKAQLHRALTTSGLEVERFLRKALAGAIACPIA